MKTPIPVKGEAQADCYHVDASCSMRYAVMLNGVFPEAKLGSVARGRGMDLLERVLPPGASGDAWFVNKLTSVAPETVPGPFGPITVFLIL